MPEAQFSALPSNFHAPLSPPPCSYSKKLLVLIQSATRSGAYKGRDTRFLPPTRGLCNYLLGFACWSAQKGGKAQKNARIKAPYHLWFNLQYLFVDKVSLINSTAVLHTRSLVSDEKKSRLTNSSTIENTDFSRKLIYFQGPDSKLRWILSIVS